MKRPTPTTKPLALSSLNRAIAIVSLLSALNLSAQYSVYNTTGDSWDVAFKYDSGNLSTTVTCAPGTTMITTVYDIIDACLLCGGHE